MILFNEPSFGFRTQYEHCAQSHWEAYARLHKPRLRVLMIQDQGGSPNHTAPQAPFQELISGFSWLLLILLAHGVLLEGRSDFAGTKAVGRRGSCYAKAAPHGGVPGLRTAHSGPPCGCLL